MTKYKDQERKRQLECYYNSFFQNGKELRSLELL